MATKIVTQEIYEVVDGISTLIEVNQLEVELATKEEVIAQKEAKLLELYEELQYFKNN